MNLNGPLLYVIIAPTEASKAYFKIGISSNLLKRVGQVQTGCPLRIKEVLHVPMSDMGSARNAESEFHLLLDKYWVSGEWFGFDTKDPAHKEAFNTAARQVLDRRLGEGWKWGRLDLKALRRRLAELRPKITADARSTVMAHAYRMAKGLPMW